uniref:Uncharacterized protein n=1 Tax=Caenorhabditis tropicalis TaxID=1561998 RepID=A0A1I7UJ25_9PELO
MTVKFKNWTLLALFFLFVPINSVDNFNVSNGLTSDDAPSSDRVSNNQEAPQFRRLRRKVNGSTKKANSAVGNNNQFQKSQHMNGAVASKSTNSIKPATQWKRTTYTCDKLPDNSRKCIIDMCERMKAIGEQGGDNNVIAIILLIVGIIGIIVNIVIFILRCRKRRKNKKMTVACPSKEDAKVVNSVPVETTPVKAPEETVSEIKKDVSKQEETKQEMKQETKETKETSVIEEPSIHSIKQNPNNRNIRTSLIQAQQKLDKLRMYVKKNRAQHKSDTRSSKFEKKGNIFIPKEPPIPPAVPLPEGIVLEDVTYDPKLNERWDIGSDVDDIELDESYRINPDSLLSDSSRNSEPRKIKGGDEKKEDGTKAGTPDAKTTAKPAEGKDGKEKSVKKDESEKDKSKKDPSKKNLSKRDEHKGP